MGPSHYLIIAIALLSVFVTVIAVQTHDDGLSQSPFVAPEEDAQNYYFETSAISIERPEHVDIPNRFHPVEESVSATKSNSKVNNLVEEHVTSISALEKGSGSSANARKHRIKREEPKTKIGGGAIRFGGPGGISQSQAQANAISASINFGPVGASFSSANSVANSNSNGGFGGPFGGPFGGGAGSGAQAAANTGSFGGGPFGGGSFSGAQAAAQSNSFGGGGGFGSPGYYPGSYGPGYYPPPGGPGYYPPHGGPGFGGVGGSAANAAAAANSGSFGGPFGGNSFSNAQASAQSNSFGGGGGYPGYYPGAYGPGAGYGPGHYPPAYYNPGGAYYPRPPYNHYNPYFGPGGGLYGGGGGYGPGIYGRGGNLRNSDKSDTQTALSPKN